jgi:spore maturation protein CgeB
MRFVLFCHSLRSDWNHGNAHFLRGVARELIARGHTVAAYEPEDGWSAANLRAEHGEDPFRRFEAAYPELRTHPVAYDAIDLGPILDDADVVLVHEWNDPRLVRRIGREKRPGSRLFFHDTHHRAATRPEEMGGYDLSRYDGVLAFGRVIRDRYLEAGWARAAWTWHEAADTRLFRPQEGEGARGDLVWIGNWGDEERTAELEEFLLGPARDLGLRPEIYGVRYPESARRALREAGAEYRGWLANYDVPRVFARHRFTLHVPRGPYTRSLPGIPTIRVFESLACGIPLLSAPWEDAEGLFTPGRDFLVARDGSEARAAMRLLLEEPEAAAELAARGLAAIRARHTCAHRVDELFRIVREAGWPAGSERPEEGPQPDAAAVSTAAAAPAPAREAAA